MPSLKAIRKRVFSVRNTQKITRAMKLIAATRLRKAQENIISMRPYARRTLEVLSSVVVRTQEDNHPLLSRREPNKIMLLVITSDRGMCGAFNTNINRNTEDYINKNKDEQDISLAIIGKKGRDYFTRRKANIKHIFTDIYEGLSLQKASIISKTIIDEYTQNELDAIYLVYNEFKSVISQKVVVEKLLPIEPLKNIDLPDVEFIYEPDRDKLLNQLLPMYVEVELYRAILESVASEYGARMTAMENATNNAEDMISHLTLQYNKARQASITKELIEIISGAETLKA